MTTIFMEHPDVSTYVLYTLELSWILDRRILHAIVKLRRVRRETCVNVANNDNVRMSYFLNFIQ